MSFFEHPGLTFAFMLAADVTIAAFTGYVGIHTLLVDGGASLGQAMNVPHVDWTALFGGEGLSFIEAGSGHVNSAAEAASHAGHAHGSFEVASLGTEGAGHVHDHGAFTENVTSSEDNPLTFE